MTRLSASEARNDFSSTLNRVAYGKDRLVLHCRGKDEVLVIVLVRIRQRRDVYRNL